LINFICYTIWLHKLTAKIKQMELKMKSKIGRSPSYLVRNPYTFCLHIKKGSTFVLPF